MPENAASALPALDNETISIFAHQLRTDLGAMKWLLQMFIDGDVGTLSAEQLALMKKAQVANDRSIALIGELLDLNRLGAKRTPQPIDIVTVIDEAIFDFTSESFKRGIEVLFLRPDTTLPPVQAEPTTLRFIIQNFIENALKYSSNGDKVFIHVAHEHDRIIFSIKDTGIGIPEEEKSHMFEKFFRAHNAKEKESIGTGLGLYFSKCIAERFGGRVWFESSTNGSTFFFELPLAEEK